MKAALFCHANGSPLEREVQQELRSQYILLERYALQHGWFIEYAAFHAGGLCLDPPDRVLSAALRHAHAKRFQVILAKSKACFSSSLWSRLPPVQIVFLQEAQPFKVGSGAEPFLSRSPSLPSHAVIYWRQASAPTSDFFLQ